MTNSQRLAKVRARFLRWLADHEQGSEGDRQVIDHTSGSSILRETILIRDEFFCGRRFYTENLIAVWFIEEDELKIYRNDGALLCVFTGTEIDDEHGSKPSKQSPHVLKLPNRDQPASDSQDSTRRAA